MGATRLGAALVTALISGPGLGNVDCEPGQPHLMLLDGPVTHAQVDTVPATAVWNPQAGSLLVGWVDDTPQLLGRHYGPDLQPVSSEPVVLVPSRTLEPALAFNPTSSRYAVVWRNQATAVGPFNSLIGRVLDSDLALVNEPMELAGISGGFEPRITANSGNGNFVAIGRSPVRAFEMAANGTPGNASAALAGDQAAAVLGSVALDPANNQYLVAWSNQGQSRLEGRILNSAVSPVAAAFTISPTQPLASSIATFWDADNARFAVPFRAFHDQRILMRTVLPDGTAGASDIELIPDPGVPVSGILTAWQPALPGLVTGRSVNGEYRLQLFDADGVARSAVVTPPAPPATTVNAITSLVALPEQGELLVVGSVLATTGSGRSMALWRYFSGECPLVFRDHFEAVAVSP